MTAPLAEVIVDAARQLGFGRVGLVPIEPPRRLALYQAWLDAGHGGEMAYLAAPEHLAARGDLRALLAEAKTLVVVALPYRRDTPPRGGELRGTIARYA